MYILYEEDMDRDFYEDEGGMSCDQVDEVSDWMEVVMECIYETGNINKLEESLDELCGILGLKMPLSPPVIQTRPVCRSDLGQEVFDLGVKMIKEKMNGIG